MKEIADRLRDEDWSLIDVTLHEDLEFFAISAFVAHNDIDPTKEWQAEIEMALGTCDVLIALLHTGFHQSFWTDQEIGFAMGRGLPVFSVYFVQDPYGFIAQFQAFDGRKKSPLSLAREVFERLRDHRQTRDRMSSALVTLFENSPSFADAKTRIGYLEKLETWSPSFSAQTSQCSRFKQTNS